MNGGEVAEDLRVGGLTRSGEIWSVEEDGMGKERV